MLGLCLLGGCNPSTDPDHEKRLRGTAYVVIGSYGQDRLTEAVVEEQEELVRLLEEDFQQLHPGVKLRLTLYREDDIPTELAARDRDGLAPDLLLVSGTTARELFRQKLSSAVAPDPQLTKVLWSHLQERIAIKDQQLVGVPMLIEPQLACFNRNRIAKSPQTLAALEAASEQGIEVGMPINALDLYWSVGALGANQALVRATWGKPLTAAENQAVLAWLQWLQMANMRERVNFYSQQEDLLQGLMEGQLDWITCRSTSLGRLRNALGSRLGVAPLPSGPGGPPTPLLRYRMWVFGRNSSPGQQRIAEAFTRFSLSPVMQRYLTLHTQEMLPVNREVSMPTGGSPVLQAMVTSEQQSRAADGMSNHLRSGDPRLERVSALLMQLIFAERAPSQTRGELLKLLGGVP